MGILSGSVYSYAEKTLPSVKGNYFEIGVFNGIGFAELGKNNSDKKCYAVDPFIEDGHTISSSGMQTGAYLSNQKQSFLDHTKDLTNIVLYEMTSKQFADQLTDEQCKEMNVSMITIDGDHHYENVVIDFGIAIRLLGKREGCIIADDTDVPGVMQAYNEFKEQYSVRIKDDIAANGATKVLIINHE